LSKVLGVFLSFAVFAIVLMALWKFANISLPAKILTVNKGDSLVSLLICLMFVVSIEPSCWCSVYHLLFVFGLSFVDCVLVTRISLDILFFDWFCCNLVLRSDHSNLYSVRFCLDWHSLFHFVMCLLLSIEANDFVLRHAVLFFA
jgi:hypothetical protein